jgi:hypothetical protein
MRNRTRKPQVAPASCGEAQGPLGRKPCGSGGAVSIVRLFTLCSVVTLSSTLHGQCVALTDTSTASARNYYQDGFILTYKGNPINQYSDVHGKVKFGMWYFFRSNGDVKSSGHFEFDLKQGWWNSYDRKGLLARRVYYKHGQRLCIIDAATEKQRSHDYNERRVGGYKLSDSQFW